MKTVEEIENEITKMWPHSTVEILQKWRKEIIQYCIDKIVKQPTTTPEEGEEDYRLGKYMAIGMLYNIKDELQ